MQVQKRKFYDPRKGFNPYQLEEIPQDWDYVELGKEESGSFKNGLNKKKEDYGHGSLHVNIDDIFKNLIIQSDGLGRVNASDEEINDYHLEKGDICLVRSSVKWKGVGYPALFENHQKNIVYSGFLIRFRPNPELWNSKFLTYLLRADFIRTNVIAWATVSANININQNSYSKIPVPHLDLTEQKKITSILSNVDSLINQTQKEIEHTQRLKIGLMHKLLTKGIDHTKFKKVPYIFKKDIQIPEDWEVRDLGSITTLLTNGFVGKATEYYTTSEKGVRYVQGYNVEKNSFNFRGIKYVPHQFNEQHPKSCLKLGDLLTIQTGDIGTTAIVPDELVGANCHALIISRFKKEIANPYYYIQYFNSKHCHRLFNTIEIGTTMKHLNGGDMKKLQFLVPPIEEQQKIASILSNTDYRISNLESNKSYFENMKRGLMQKLLTGKIRV